MHGPPCGNWNSSVVRIKIPHRVLFQFARVVIIQPADRHSLLTKEFCPIPSEIHLQIAWGQFASATCASFRLDARYTLSCEMEVRTARLTAPHHCTHRRRCRVRAGIRMNHERTRVTLQFVKKRALAHNFPLYQLSAIDHPSCRVMPATGITAVGEYGIACPPDAENGWLVEAIICGGTTAGNRSSSVHCFLNLSVSRSASSFTIKVSHVPWRNPPQSASSLE